ncbi:MAG: TetR family transcriptional regulator [Hydrogenophaga sp.]|nr:TetR family transcriptional regulator [Hydrogenophaga sp.]
MARRTKADAEATRNALLDAAEQLFQARGVSGTSLQDIANAAGTTRGAIYWHFKDKADLFNAMMERVTLPLEETLACAGNLSAANEDPLPALRQSMFQALAKTALDEQTRRVFEIATHQVEYNDEMNPVRERHLRVRNDCLEHAARAFRAAATHHGITLPVSASTAAHGLQAIVNGLIQNWLLDHGGFDLRRVGRQTIDAYLVGLGFKLGARASPRRSVHPA